MRVFKVLTGAAICLALLLTASWLPALDPLADAELFGREIRSIQYLADQALQRARYDRSIGLKPGDTLTRTRLKAAIQALYDTGSFSEISASATPEGDGVQLQFHLRLSTFFNRFIIAGGVNLGGRSASEAMALPVGERFSEQNLEEARLAVLRYMQERGFYGAQVEARTAPVRGGSQVDATFEVQAGELATVRSLVISGIPPREIAAIGGRLNLRAGQKYDRARFLRRVDALKTYLANRGFLDAELRFSESYQAADNAVALDLSIANFGQVRIEVEGFKIERAQLRRLLPALSGEGLRPELLEEGMVNLRRHLEELGYPEAGVTIQDSRDASGVRLLHYVIDRGRKVTVSEVLFRGNRAFADVDLFKAIQIQPARFLQKSTYSVSKLDADVEALRTRYKSAGYLNAAVVPLVEPLKNGEKLKITFECEEGAQARTGSIGIAGNSSVSEADLKARMRLNPGAPYSPYIAEHDRQAILAAYNDAGFLQPVVTYREDGPDGSQRYAVAFQIKEGARSYIDKVVILGQDRTRDSVIAKRLRVRPDDPLSLGRMLETQQALYNTGVFDLVRVTPQNPDSAATVQNVIVRLQEARPFTVRYGFGYQEREKVRGILELSHLSLFGLGRRVDFRLRGSTIEQTGILSFQQPQIRFLPVDSYFTFSGSKKKEISFDERRLDLSYQYSRPINNHTWGMLRYNFTNVRVSNTPPDLAREVTPRNLSTVSAFYVNDTRDNYLDPEKGFSTSTDLSITTKLPARQLASGFYASLYTQNSYYRKLAGPVQVASSLRFGIRHPFAGDRSIPISERFFAGGGSSLRGFETDRAGPLGPNNEPVGGNALLIGNLELRVPLISRFELAGFYDGGNVFPDVGSIRFSDFSHTLGAGLRLKTPFGPIRIDYGVNLNLSSYLRSIGYGRGHFFLTIGPPF